MSDTVVPLSKAQVEAILNRYTKKKRAGETVVGNHDAANKEIFNSLEDNTAYFLESIKDRIGRYEENLREIIIHRYPNATKGAPLDTPLLRRTFMGTVSTATTAPGATSEDDPTPEQTLINNCPKITIKLLRERFAATYGDNYSEEDMTAAMEALAKRSGGKRNRDGTINTNPIVEIDPTVPHAGKTLKAASRGGEQENAEGETITLDPNDPAVLKAILGAMLAAKGGKKDGKKGAAGAGDAKGGDSKLTSGKLAQALAEAAGGAGADGDAGDGMYEDSDASSGIDIAEDCEAPEIELPDHSPLVAGYAALKKECYELDITFQGIFDWITLNLQNSSENREREGEVAEGINGQIQEMQEQIGQIYDALGTYLANRVEMELAVLNYPHVTSFAQTLLSADDAAWFEVERSWRELIRATLYIYYLVSNNLESLVAVASPTTGSYSIYQ